MQLFFTEERIKTVDDYVLVHQHWYRTPKWEDKIHRVAVLLRHLQDNVDASPHWVTFSHIMMFYLTEQNTWFHHKGRLFACPTKDGYWIKYRSAREIDFEKSYTVVEVPTLEEAGKLIAWVLENAETDLPDIPGRPVPR